MSPLVRFFHQCSTYIANNATCFVFWLNVKIKRNFYSIWHNDMISWTMYYISINLLVWIGKIWFT